MIIYKNRKVIPLWQAVGIVYAVKGDLIQTIFVVSVRWLQLEIISNNFTITENV